MRPNNNNNNNNIVTSCQCNLTERLHSCHTWTVQSREPPSDTCFLGHTWLHIPNGILIGSSIFEQLTVESPETPYALQCAAPFPLKIATLHWGSGLHIIHAFLSLPESTARTASQSVQPFLHRWPQSVPILYNKAAPFPLEITPFIWRFWTSI